MYMKNHILAALREEFDHWEKVLASPSEGEITTAPQPGALSIKDEIAHLWAWQQRSLARLEAALNDNEPKMPQWLPGITADSEEDTDQINAWIYVTYQSRSWPEVYQAWRAGFLRLLELGAAIEEPALLDSSRYAWLGGYALAHVLIGSYDHHQEHLEKLLSRVHAKPEEPSSDLPKVAAPAQRALSAAGYQRLDQLAQVSAVELMQLHGMGPKAIGVLRQALHKKGLTFAKAKRND
jgi:hypothetical protein